MNVLEKSLGANWKTRVSAFGTIVFAALTFVSGISYDVSPLALIMPPEWKPRVLLISGIATAILWAWNGVNQKSKDVTGGTIRQAAGGEVIAKADVDISNLPEAFEVQKNGQWMRKLTKNANPVELAALIEAVGTRAI